jgi:hypothetical protein
MVMRSHPASHVLTFWMPKGARADSGIRVDSPFQCQVEIGKLGFVTALGPSRPAVFDQAARVLRLACDGMPPLWLSGTLYTQDQARDDGRDWLHLPRPSDGWTIIVMRGCVAFSPTSLDPEIPDLGDVWPVLLVPKAVTS